MLNLSEHDLIVLFAGTLFNFSGLDLILKDLPKYLNLVPMEEVSKKIFKKVG